MEALRELLGWYLAPWRRIDRTGFNVALLIVSLPGLVMMFVGIGGMTSSVLSGLGQLQELRSSGDPAQMLSGLQGMMAPQPEGKAAFDWSGLINGLCFLAFIPFCRMRLRDMGWVGMRELVWTVLINTSVVAGLVAVLTGWNVLPMSWLFGLLTFGGYIWLAVVKGKPRQQQWESRDNGY